MEPQASPELQSALWDLNRYLLDQIPPLSASEAVETLMAAPPELVMRQVANWSSEQARHQDASQGDLLYHALRKIHVVSMLKLIDRAQMEAYLDRVYPLAIAACPAEERELLGQSLKGLRDSMTVEAPSTVVPIRNTAAAAKPAPRGAVTEVVARSTKRLSMIVERLAKHIPSFGGGSEKSETKAEPPPAAQLVSMAAASSTSEEELKAYLQSVGSYTGETDPMKLFHVLAAAVPQWEIAAPPDARQPAAIEAMHKIIALTSDTQESTRRLRELMSEAVSYFNSGALGASVSMLELASQVMREKKIDANTVERIRHDAVESISPEQLRVRGEQDQARRAAPRAQLLPDAYTREPVRAAPRRAASGAPPLAARPPRGVRPRGARLGAGRAGD